MNHIGVSTTGARGRSMKSEFRRVGWARRIVAVTLSVSMAVGGVPTYAIADSGVKGDAGVTPAQSDPLSALVIEVQTEAGQDASHLDLATKLWEKLSTVGKESEQDPLAVQLVDAIDEPNASKAVSEAYVRAAEALGLISESFDDGENSYKNRVTIDGTVYVVDASTDDEAGKPQAVDDKEQDISDDSSTNKNASSLSNESSGQTLSSTTIEEVNADKGDASQSTPVKDGVAVSGTGETDAITNAAGNDAKLVAQDDSESRKTSLAGATIVLEKTAFEYAGQDIKPAVTSVKASNKDVPASAYTVSYKNNKAAGTATVTVAAKGGEYTGSADAQFTISAVSIAKASVDPIADQAYTGKSVTPAVSLVFNNAKVEAEDYTVTYSNNVEAGTATATIQGRRNFSGSTTVSYKIVKPTVSYMVHVQGIGDQTPWRSDGSTAGTSGESKRLEALSAKIEPGFPIAGGITYHAHIQSTGWETEWKSDGDRSGTTGSSKRLEAVEMKLTDKLAEAYDLYYRVHAQRVGWTSWASNGQVCGTSGMSWRLEAIQIQLVPKGMPAPSNEGSDTSLTSVSNPGVTYHTHVQRDSWQGWVSNGETSGTTGRGLRTEAIEAKLASTEVPGSIIYSTHVQGIGWTDWVSDGDLSGTTGESRRIEAIKFALDGEVSKYFDVWYRAHVQSAGWLGWTANGAEAGSTGSSKRLEAYEVVLVPKGRPAPGDTQNPLRDKAYFDFLEEQKDPLYQDAQGYSSPTDWLILVNCSSCEVGIFHGSQNNWRRYDKYEVGVGAYETPSKHGIWSVGARGYSFGGSDYTCYYWVSYYNDYLFHTVPCWAGTWDIKDGRLGMHVSHGCVRQSFDKAKWLYDNIPSGTTVVVYD